MPTAGVMSRSANPARKSGPDVGVSWAAIALVESLTEVPRTAPCFRNSLRSMEIPLGLSPSGLCRQSARALLPGVSFAQHAIKLRPAKTRMKHGLGSTLDQELAAKFCQDHDLLGSVVGRLCYELAVRTVYQDDWISVVLPRAVGYRAAGIDGDEEEAVVDGPRRKGALRIILPGAVAPCVIRITPPFSHGPDIRRKEHLCALQGNQPR